MGRKIKEDKIGKKEREQGFYRRSSRGTLQHCACYLLRHIVVYSKIFKGKGELILTEYLYLPEKLKYLSAVGC